MLKQKIQIKNLLNEIEDPIYQEVRQQNKARLNEFDDGLWVLLRSVFYWIILLLVTLLLGSLALPFALLRLSRTVHAIATLWGNAFVTIFGARIHIHGKENLYTGSSALIVANHQSISDIFIYYAVLRQVQFRWMAKQSLFYIPILGWAMSGAGYIPVDRSNQRKAGQSMYKAAREIMKGKSVIIFPEGTTGHVDGSMIPFKKGAFMLAKKSHATIQPISQFGAHKIVPEQIGRIIQRVYRSDVHVYIHPPIAASEYESLSPAELSQQIRTIIEKPIKQHQEAAHQN